jgi:hypothetical protein
MLSLKIIRSMVPTQEIWKSLDLMNFPNYEISSYGRIKNVKTGRILVGGISVGG